MTFEERKEAAVSLARLEPHRRFAALMRMPEAVRTGWVNDWERWAHEGQLAPAGEAWRVWLIRAGRGFGKTRAGAEWVCEVARTVPDARIALVGATIDEVRKVMVEGESGLLAVARDGDGLDWRSTAGELHWASGSQAAIFSSERPESLRGAQHHAAWCDELGKWRRGDATWNNLLLGLRLGEAPRAVVTTTPRANPLMRRVMAMKRTVETRGRTHDNPWLADAYIEMVEELFAGTALGRQELDGEMLEDVDGALWTRALIERARVPAPPELVRVVVGVDPPASAAGDACGIVAMGLGRDDRAYLLEDATVAGAAPEVWAHAVAACAARWGADRVVAEKNQGGDMVGSVLRAADEALPLELVHASRGKGARAEPVQLLYQRGLVKHAGVFPELEDQLCGLRTAGGYEGPERSPDRADACVWAVWALKMGRKAEVGVTLL